jgi:hypothetical protein
MESHVKYEVQNKEVLSEEIIDIDCQVTRSGNELTLYVVKCNSYGADKCNGRKIIGDSLELTPYFEKTGDTLTLTEIKESTRFYTCRDFQQLLRDNHTLAVHLTYKVDSSNVTKDRNLFLSLDKDESYQFSVH